jgi:hypothetical protein
MDSDKRIVKVATKLTISLKLAVRWCWAWRNGIGIPLLRKREFAGVIMVEVLIEVVFRSR